MNNQQKNCFPQLWAGLECSINRVNNNFFDQFEFSGCYRNKNHIEALISLGVKAVRYPLLWERYQKDLQTKIRFNEAHKDVHQLLEARIQPIIGLLHHGSGPAFTNLEDENLQQL